jgi:hypothetical protein
VGLIMTIIAIVANSKRWLVMMVLGITSLKTIALAKASDFPRLVEMSKSPVSLIDIDIGSTNDQGSSSSGGHSSSGSSHSNSKNKKIKD